MKETTHACLIFPCARTLFISRIFFFLFINSTADIVWSGCSEKKKTLYKYASVFGKQQIFKQKQNEGIVPNTTTRDMHTLTLSQGAGKQNAQESKEATGNVSRFFVHTRELVKQKKTKKTKRCTEWVHYVTKLKKKKPFVITGKDPQPRSKKKLKNHTGTRATPCRQNSKHPSWQYIFFCTKLTHSQTIN